MTAQAAFQSWLVYIGAIAGGVVFLASCIALVVVAFSWSRQREDEK